MSKMSPRKFSNLIPTEAYKNVLKDNARSDHLKKLLLI
jgi:hypothetical protein